MAIAVVGEGCFISEILLLWALKKSLIFKITVPVNIGSKKKSCCSYTANLMRLSSTKVHFLVQAIQSRSSSSSCHSDTHTYTHTKSYGKVKLTIEDSQVARIPPRPTM
jgi:hypothetical protein